MVGAGTQRERCFSCPMNRLVAHPVNPTMSDARIAVLKVSMWNDDITWLTISTMQPLMTKRKSPSVRNVIGNVRKTTMGRTMALTKPSRSAAAKSDVVVSNRTPLRISSATHRPKAVINSRAINDGISSLQYDCEDWLVSGSARWERRLRR